MSERPIDWDAAEIIADELRDAAPLTVVLRASTALELVGLIQLARRHPGVPERIAVTADVFIEHVRAYFVDLGAHMTVEAIRQGNDPEL